MWTQNWFSEIKEIHIKPNSLLFFQKCNFSLNDISDYISQDEHMDSERGDPGVIRSFIWNTAQLTSVDVSLKFINCLLMFTMGSKSKILAYISSVLEMEKWQARFAFLSYLLLLNIVLYPFPFHYPQTAAGKITFSVQFYHALCLKFFNLVLKCKSTCSQQWIKWCD